MNNVKALTLFITLLSLNFFSVGAKGQTQPGCVDLNGHFVYKQFLGSADAVIKQTECEKVRVKIIAKVLGQTYNADVETPVDGEMHEVPRQDNIQNPNDQIFATAKFLDNSLVLLIDTFTKTGKDTVKHNQNLLTLTLVSSKNLDVAFSDISASGAPINTKKFAFKRVTRGLFSQLIQQR
jgi:uncharacterized glyoxalase superfamily protein PhnB